MLSPQGTRLDFRMPTNDMGSKKCSGRNIGSGRTRLTFRRPF